MRAFTSLFTTIGTSLILMGALPAEGWASGSVQALIRPVDASSPFTFQQKLPDVPNDIDRKYIAVDTGGSSICGIREDRGLDCWGPNQFGEASAPLKGKFKALSLGATVGCALTTNNRVGCWGALPISQPNPEQSKRRYIEISAGGDHVCAITMGTRAIECWGNNSHGQLNHPQGAFKTISSGTNKTCALSTKGALACWGDPAFLSYPPPAGKFKDVSVGTLHGCAVRSDDDGLACWGNGYYGEDLPPSGRFKAVTSGTDHTCGWRADRTAVCWGRNQWGQLDLPGDIKLISLNAGGHQTCAISRKKRLICRGSFAYNSLLFPHQGDVQASSANQQVRPQIDIIDDVGGNMITNFIGGLFVNWGDSTDGVFGDTLLFIGGLFGVISNNETIEKLQAIQNQLNNLAISLAELDKKSSAILSEIKTLNCDDKLGDLDAAVKNIREANRKYQGTGPLTDTGSYMELVRNELTKAQQAGYVPTDLRPSMRQFVMDWYGKVAEDIARIDAVLMNANYKSGPLGACLDKAFMAYQSQIGDKQFDDRRIWKGIYWIIQRAMVDQALGAQMLLDMNKFSAITALSDPSVEPGTPVIPEGVDWNPATLCADVKAHSTQAASNHRWDQALKACKANEGVTRQLYRNLVQQVELAGAPYTDKDVTLSMGSDLLGKGSATENYLWLRSFDRSLPGLWTGHWNWAMSQETNDMAGHGDANIYFTEGNTDKLGTWRSDGNAWNRLVENAKSAGFQADRIKYMSEAISDIDGGNLFNSSMKGISFWMTGSTYTMDWQKVVKGEGDSSLKEGAKCLIASDIGRVCSSEEFSHLWGGDCSTDEQYFWTRVTYVTCGWNSHAKQYTQDQGLGELSLQYFYRPMAKYDTARHLEKVITVPEIFPNSNNFLYRMPVLNVGERTCTPAMVTGNQSRPRENYRLVAGSDGSSHELPSRCGTDLDYFIDMMIKRPDVPELDALVRKPIFPAGVN